MKRSVAIMLALLTAVIAACFTGCVSISDTYPDSDKYSSGNAEFKSSEVRSIDINWRSGSITVTRHDADNVTVTESCKNDLKDSQKVHTWLDGDTLRIQYCESGETFIGFNSPQKSLEILIPEDMELSELSYDGSSGDAKFENITADTISVDVSSGDADIISCSAKYFDVESSSGDITIEQKGEAVSIEAEASSGDIDITAEKTGELDAEASSGKIVVRLENMPADTDIDTSSGNVKVYVPEDADFTADIDTSSGDFDSDLALSKDGDTYTKGSGTNKLSIDTSSGDIKILSLAD
jgi:DUF4097 and DUF4098 domain-containing protein YvlB